MRLDVFLKRAGLVKQRSLAKEMCDEGLVKIAGRPVKAGKEIEAGSVVEIDLETERMEIEVLDLPERNYKREKGLVFYRITEHEYKDRYS